MELVGRFGRGPIYEGGGTVHELIVRETDAFAMVGNILVWLDLTHRERPVRLAYYYFPSGAKLISVDPETPEAFVTSGSHLSSVDFTDPASPVVANLYNTTWEIKNAKIDDNRAYLHVEFCYQGHCGVGLHEVDISKREFEADPLVCSSGRKGELAVHKAFPAGETTLQRSESLAFYESIAAGADGIRIYEQTEDGKRIEVGANDPPSSFVAVVSVGQFAYLAEAEGGLYVVDISEPSNPVQAGLYGHSKDFIDLAYESGPYLYAISDGGAEFEIIDVSSPSDPQFVGSLHADQRYVDVEVVNERAYLLEQEKGLVTIDVAQPDHPGVLGSYRPGEIISFAVRDEKAFVLVDLSERKELQVVDLSSPARPRVISHKFLHDPVAVAVSGDLAYVIDVDDAFMERLVVFDVSTARAPTLMGRLPIAGYQGQTGYIVAEDDLAYIPGGGLFVMDLDSPNRVARFDMFGTFSKRGITDADITEPYILLSDGADGLFILRFERTALACHEDITTGDWEALKQLGFPDPPTEGAPLLLGCG
jgi:hypothetical protein